MRATLALLLAIPLALSGCSDQADPAVDQPGAQAAVAGPVWSNQTLEGTFAGVSTPIASANPLVILGDGYGSHSFDVPAGAKRLEVSLHLVTPVMEVTLRLLPDCDCDPIDAVTQGGMVTVSLDDPSPGAWESLMFQQTPGPGATQYHLSVGVLA